MPANSSVDEKILLMLALMQCRYFRFDLIVFYIRFETNETRSRGMSDLACDDDYYLTECVVHVAVA